MLADQSVYGGGRVSRRNDAILLFTPKSTRISKKLKKHENIYSPFFVKL